MTLSWEAITAISAVVATLIAVVTPLAMILIRSGKQEQAIANLTDTVKAVHARMDEAKKEYRQADLNLNAKLETMDNNIMAKIYEIHDALVASDIIVPGGLNGKKLEVK